MGIAAIVTAVGTVFAGHVTDRNANVDHNERMHRSSLSYNAEDRSSMKFQIRVLQRQVEELHADFYGEPRSLHRRAGASGDNAPASSDPTRPPRPRHRHEDPRDRRSIDHYDKLMEAVGEGGVYLPKGYGH